MSFNSFFLIFVFIISVTSCQNNYHEQKQLQKSRAQQIDENLEKANRGLVSLDSSRIVGVIRANGWDMKVTQTGLWYELVDRGSGLPAKAGMRATITYKVRLLDGRLVYSSDSTGIKQFTITKGGVERGLEEGILLMKEGDSARFIMPPYMAHHLLGDQEKIPPRATIIYEVRLKTLTK